MGGFLKFDFKAKKDLKVKEFLNKLALRYNLEIQIEDGPEDLFRFNDSGTVTVKGKGKDLVKFELVIIHIELEERMKASILE
jgi:hypothetical protein